MNFLVDHQLPPALARFLESQGHSARHVREMGLKEADDKIIWDCAAKNGMTIVSKDEDFYWIAVSQRTPGTLIWVKIGNCRKQTLIEIFRAKLPQIVAAFETGSRIVEIR